MNKIFKLTLKEYSALASLVDLAEQTVADSEYDYLSIRPDQIRRNGGYSQDVRITNKLLIKLRKFITEEK